VIIARDLLRVRQDKRRTVRAEVEAREPLRLRDWAVVRMLAIANCLFQILEKSQVALVAPFCAFIRVETHGSGGDVHGGGAGSRKGQERRRSSEDERV
jgi:hypothetical protein